jgi:hypothetical protein
VTDAEREALEVDALRTDRYLEALLTAADRHASDVPADADLDPGVRAAATRLAAELVRVHPSFRFEERLAARLAQAARSIQLAAAAGGESLPLGLPATIAGEPIEAASTGDDLDQLDPAAADDAGDPDGAAIRPYLIGGALTSAALSLAGAAFVAWRRTRPQPVRSPMARAVRAARQARAQRRLS